jgi:hypothetical protein
MFHAANSLYLPTGASCRNANHDAERTIFFPLLNWKCPSCANSAIHAVPKFSPLKKLLAGEYNTCLTVRESRLQTPKPKMLIDFPALYSGPVFFRKIMPFVKSLPGPIDQDFAPEIIS